MAVESAREGSPWAGCVERFRGAYLAGAEAPIAVGGGWAIAALLPSPYGPAVRLRMERAGGGRFTVVVEPRSGAPCFTRTARLNVAQDGAIEGARGDEVAAPMRALAERLEERERALAPEEAEAVFRVAAPAARERHAPAAEESLTPFLQAFHRLYLDGAPLPIAAITGDGRWSIEALVPSPFSAAGIVRLGRDDGASFGVVVEARGAGEARLSTAHLGLAQEPGARGVSGPELDEPMAALARRLAEREERIARADVDAMFGARPQPSRASGRVDRGPGRSPAIAAFERLYLDGAPLPIALGPSSRWQLASLEPDPASPGVVLRLRRDDGADLAVLADARAAGRSHAATNYLGLSQHGAAPSVAHADAGAAIAELASLLARREGAIPEDEARSIFGAAPHRAAAPALAEDPARRVRLDVISERAEGAAAEAPWRAGRAWPLKVSEFHRIYFGGAPLPHPIGGGWSVDSISAARVNRGLELRLRRDDGASFSANVEPRSSMRCFLATAFLNLTHEKSDGGVPREEMIPALRTLGEALRDKETGLARADVDAAFAAPCDDGEPAAMRPVDFRINRDCNEYCLFCNTPPDADRILEGAREVHEAIEREHALGFRRCYFTGREPTLDPNLPDYIRHARRVGYEDVGMHTNGTMLAKRAYLERLQEAGLTSVQVSMHTFDRATFEALVGAPRLLDKTLEGLRNVAEARDLRLYLLFVATTRNMGELPEFLATVAREYGSRVDFVLVSPMAPMGDGRKHPELLPRFDALRPLLDGALRRARDLGVTVRIPDRCGLPLCATPPEFLPLNLELQNPPGDNVEPDKTKLPACADCRFDSRCSGVWQGYVQAHGPAIVNPVA